MAVLSFLNTKSDKFNILANYGGTILTAIISLLFIPIYIKYLGIESYGILGFFLSVQGLLAFLDLGLGIAINQEMAKHYHDKTKISYLNNLAYSLQLVYWAIGLFIALILFLGTPYLSTSWFKGTKIDVHSLRICFILMAATLAANWPYSIYASGLRGMQFQVLLNIHDFCYNLLKAVGSLLVLIYVENTLIAFLTFQLCVILCQTITLHFIFWHKLPKSNVPKKFDKTVLKNIARYAAAMGVASVIGSFVYQLDKIILSKMLQTKMFGYYTLAFNLAILVNNITMPVFMATFPKFTSLVHNKDQEEVQKKYQYFSKLIAALIMPVSCIIFFFAKQLVYAWTKDIEIANNVAPILRLLIIATTLNALMVMPHALMLANRDVKMMLKSHIIAGLFFIPSILFLTNKFGVLGGAMALIGLYGGYFFVQAFVIMKKYNPLQILQWYLNDIGLYVVIAIMIMYLFSAVLPVMDTWQRLPILATLFGAWFVCALFCLGNIKSVRNLVLLKLIKNEQ